MGSGDCHDDDELGCINDGVGDDDNGDHLIIDDDDEIVNMMTISMMMMMTTMMTTISHIEYLTQVPAAMDGVPAPISMLVDPSTNPEAIALVSPHFHSANTSSFSVISIFTQPELSFFHSAQVILILTQSKSF